MTRVPWRIGLFVLASSWGGMAVGAQDVQEQPVETNSFSIPETLLVRALHERALGHIAARRNVEAIADLQTILEKHAGELLPGERPLSRSGRASEGLVHSGASARARAALFGLPTEARTRYRERHEPEAARALDTARAAGDLEALVEVGRRWPLTDAAIAAYIAVGDLELERGRPREAACAWARAIGYALLEPDLSPSDAREWSQLADRLAQGGDGPLCAALRARCASAGSESDAKRRAERLRDRERNLRLPTSDTTGGPLPLERADTWAQPFPLPSHPFREPARDAARDALFAVRSGERLFVSNSLRLMCLHAYTGELLWDSGEPRGWSNLSQSDRNELFKGVDRGACLVSPAVSDTVVVAALQLPRSLQRSDSYGQIQILTPIPERRLFAFDVATGRKLWDHTPPPEWDGEGGTFAEGTNAAAPPVIAGSRVLVPCVRPQGRINYNVGCFDLFTGELLWSRDVISGQREQNMFGRSMHEFCTAPLVVEGDRVVALTQLGTVAALDLFTGEILWETLHETLPIPRPRAFEVPTYVNFWQNTPPLVEGGVVIAAPFCSRDLIALDLATGCLLWSMDWQSISDIAGKSRPDVLFGSARDAIYVGGERWLALHMPAGVGERGALRTKAQSPDDDGAQLRSRAGRPVLADDRVVDPRVTERFDFDRHTGARLSATRWPEGSQGGNVLVGTGEMFVVSGSDVRGYFEWDVLVGRARAELAEAPNDARAVLRLARLLDGRGSSEWQRGEADAARMHLTEARSILERVLGKDGSAADLDEARASLSGVYHSILRQGARVRAGLADSKGALQDLVIARRFAPDRTALRDTLVEELAILREREGTPLADPGAVASVLDDLERACADLPLSVGFRIPSDATSTPFGIELSPLALPRAEDPSAPPELPVGLWVLVERDARAARREDTAAEFAALHAILERYADVDILTWKAGELAGQRIEALLAAGRRTGYEPFEERAQRLYEEGLSRQDDDALRRVAERFPGSRAARASNDARLELALSSGDLATVARIVQSELPDGFDLDTAAARDVARLVRLADALQRAGNRTARAALLRALAGKSGSFVSDLPADGGATIAALADAAPRFAEARRTRARGAFHSGTDAASERGFVGEYECLGETLPAEPLSDVPAGRTEKLVFARSFGRFTTSLVALDAADPTVERWTADLPPRTAQSTGNWTRRSAFAPGRVIVAGNEKLLGLDEDTGAEVWDWSPSLPVESMTLACRSGVVVISASPREAGERWFLVALDAHTGAELWRLAALDAAVQPSPLVTDQRLVFLPAPGHRQVLVLDLFTGSRARRFDLDTPAVASIDADAWIEGDTLIVPWLVQQSNVERNHVLAYDLSTGRRSWRVPLASGAESRWLGGVLQQEGRTWVLLQGRSASEPGRIEQSLQRLDTRIGALTPAAALRIGPDDRILGLGRPARVELPAGPIALLSPRSAGGRGPVGDARVRALDLDRGELWVQGLGIPFEELAPVPLPPALASDTILVVVTVPNASAGPIANLRADLRAFDVATGLPRGMRSLPMVDSRDVPQLTPLGDLLIARTKSRLELLK